MGMQFKMEQITPQQLESFLKNPDTLYDYIMAGFNEGPDITNFLQMIAEQRRNMTPQQKANLDRLANMLPEGPTKLSGLKLVPKPGQIEPKESASRKQFSLEKDWHVLHYALNGTTEGGKGAIGKAILGGIEIPDRKGVMGYGPAQYLRPDEVKEVAKELENVNPQTLLTNLDKQDAEKKQIYLAHTLDRPGDWDYLPDLFSRFRDFYRDAADHGNAMLLTMQ